jgi:hypothetical protein
MPNRSNHRKHSTDDYKPDEPKDDGREEVEITQDQTGDSQPVPALTCSTNLAASNVPKDDSQHAADKWAQEPRDDSKDQGGNGCAVGSRSIDKNGWRGSGELRVRLEARCRRR